MLPRWLPTAWPLVAALISLLVLAAVHAVETFGHLAPCELCLKQRTVYWAAAAVGLVGYGAGRGLRSPVLFSLACLLLGPLLGLVGAVVFGWFAVQLSGVYFAMLTLAFAQIVWSIAFQWIEITGGDNGLLGVWPAA